MWVLGLIPGIAKKKKKINNLKKESFILFVYKLYSIYIWNICKYIIYKIYNCTYIKYIYK